MATTLFTDVVTDQRVSEAISGEYMLLAADRAALGNHPALVYGGDFAGSGAGIGSSSRKIPILGLMGYDLPAAVAEGAAIVPGRVTDQQAAVVVTRRGKAYEPSDEVRFTDPLGVFNAAKFAEDAVISVELAMTNLIASLLGGFSLSQETTGVNLTFAVFLAAIGDLEVGSQGMAGPDNTLAMLHTRQVADLRDSIVTATGGAVQWSPMAQDQLAMKRAGFVGKVAGIDLFSSAYVPTANSGADRAGGIFTTGGIVWADATPTAETSDATVLGGKVLYEVSRTALSGLTAYVSSCWLGASRGYDTAPNQLGVAIKTDA